MRNIYRKQALCAAAYIAALHGLAVAADNKASAQTPPMQQAAATANLSPTQGNSARGKVTFGLSGGEKVNIQVRLSHLPRVGEYGLHIHEVGDCSAPDATSAGDHFNPMGKNHGDRTALERHAGDLGNVKANAKGEVSATFDIEGVTIDSAKSGILGKSVVLHANADDLKSQPGGNAGARIACGVIGGQAKATPRSSSGSN